MRALRAPRSRNPGFPGNRVNAAGGLYAAGLTHKINKAIDAKNRTTGAGSTAGGGATSAGGKYDSSALAKLWTSAGGNPGSAHLAAAVALAESGGNPNALNHNTNGTVDRGLWQINSIHGNKSVFDPMGNARAAVSISSNGGSWVPWVTYHTGAYLKFMERGGRVGGRPGMPEWGGWHGRGGEFTAHGPTMIGVGEAGAERVKVTPLSHSGGSGGGHVFKVHIERIENHREGDVGEMIEKELRKVAHALKHGPLDSEDEMG
jgi:hypothetical protein